MADDPSRSLNRAAWWSLCSNGAAYLLGVLTLLAISKILGPAPVGEYWMAVNLNVILTALLSFGIGLGGMTFVASREHSISEVHYVFLAFSGLSGVLGGGLYAVAGLLGWNGLFGDMRPHSFLVAFLALPLSVYSLYWNCLMVGLGEIVLQSKVVIGLAVLLYGSSIVLVMLGFGIRELLGCWAFSLAAGCAVMMGIVLAKDRRFAVASPGLFGKLFLFGFKGNVGEIATQVWKRMNVFLLNYFYGLHATGVYSVAVDLNEKLLLLAGPVRNAATSRIVQDDPRSSGRLTLALTTRLFLGFVSAGALLFVLSGPLVPRFYGVAFAASVAPLRILLLGTVAAGSTTLIGMYFIGQLRRPGLLSTLALANAGVSVVLGFALVPSYGIPGAAAAYSLTGVIGTVLLLVIFRRLREA